MNSYFAFMFTFSVMVATGKAAEFGKKPFEMESRSRWLTLEEMQDFDVLLVPDRGIHALHGEITKKLHLRRRESEPAPCAALSEVTTPRRMVIRQMKQRRLERRDSGRGVISAHSRGRAGADSV